jgi:hypothetical protein
MKLVAIIVILSVFSISSVNYAQSIDDTHKYECTSYFAFQGRIIDLDINLFLPDTTEVEEVFQTCSKYNGRFSSSDFSETPTPWGACSIYQNSTDGIYQLYWHKRGEELRKIDMPIEKPLPEVHSYSFLIFNHDDDVILVIDDFYGTHYKLFKYNSDAEIVDQMEIEHTYITHPDEETNYYHPYLNFTDATSKTLVFTSEGVFEERNRTILFSLVDFSTKEFDITLCGLIYNELDTEIIGLAENLDSGFNVEMLDGRKFEIDLDYSEPLSDFILQNNKLYIANYHPIATGSSLYCYDLEKDEIIWTADVKQINASHSKYFNKVTLFTYLDKIVMYGNEAFGKYVQIFDAESGERLAAFGDFYDID